ncbi:uncharacterized protein V1516DRAFT_674902 [Lipomyces oligophaga]|uniref:uncharacterized protein n=1 Tax=Lipomyces oligophaga TaxID=45792 RepID=UPI0034CF55B7
MSSRSGITTSDELLKAFNAFAEDENARTFTIKIDGESLQAGDQLPVIADYISDMDNISSAISAKEPLYIIHRGENNGFIFISYIPDNAPVRRKMLYASTRNTLTRELGSDKLTMSVFATEPEELSADGLRKFINHDKLSKPLSEEERALQSVKDIEAKEGFAGTTTRKTYTSGGLTFPLDEEVQAALAGLQSGADNTVILEIDTQKEVIILGLKAEHFADELSDVISDDSPRYTLFLFKHEYDSTEQEALVFIHTCPQGSKIKERMLYASCRSSIIAQAEEASGIKIAKRIELTDGSEISEQMLMDDLHPKAAATKARFARPRAPGRRR